MRVAIFTETYFPFISGVVTHIQTLKEGLEAKGHTVLIVTLDPKTRQHYVKNNVLYCPAHPLKRIYGYGVANPVNRHRLNIIRSFNPDIIHLHTEFSIGIFALYAASQLHRPAVYTLHTMYDDYVFYLFPEKTPDRMKKMARPLARSYIRNVASRATEIIGPSYKVADYLRRCGVERHVNIVPNTVDLTDFLPKNANKTEIAALKKELGIQKGDVAIAFVGRLGKEKSLDVLINYFQKGFKGQKKFHLFIAGDGPDKKLLQEEIDKYGVGDQVKLVGRIDHSRVPHFYHACDLFATASLTEMNSISMLEATASGLYALQRLDIFNRDQIVSGKNGDVFTSAEEFKQLVQEYADLDEKGRRDRQKMVSDYAQRYGPAEFTEEVLKVYARAQYKNDHSDPNDSKNKWPAHIRNPFRGDHFLHY